MSQGLSNWPGPVPREPKEPSTDPALSSLVSQVAQRHEQGIVLGLNQSLHSLAALLAPPLAGLLIEHRLLPHWAMVAAVAAVVGLLLTRWGSGRAPATLATGTR